MTAVSVPPPRPDPAAAPASRPVLSCSHCGAELSIQELADALVGALHAAPVPGGSTPRQPSGDWAAALRPRQREIVALLVEGWRVATIAERLGIRPDSVRKHLQIVYAQVGVHSQAELVAWVRSGGAPRLRAVRTVPASHR